MRETLLTLPTNFLKFLSAANFLRFLSAAVNCKILCGNSAIISALPFTSLSTVFKDLLTLDPMDIDHILEQTNVHCLGRGEDNHHTPVRGQCTRVTDKLSRIHLENKRGCLKTSTTELFGDFQPLFVSPFQLESTKPPPNMHQTDPANKFVSKSAAVAHLFKFVVQL